MLWNKSGKASAKASDLTAEFAVEDKGAGESETPFKFTSLVDDGR